MGRCNCRSWVNVLDVKQKAKDLAAERRTTPSAIAHAKRSALRKTRRRAQSISEEPLRTALELLLDEEDPKKQ